MNEYDEVVIGGAAAGLSAGLVLSRHRLARLLTRQPR
jgi:thioredoxin reductase